MPTMQILTTLVPKLNEVFSAYAQFKTILVGKTKLYAKQLPCEIYIYVDLNEYPKF